MNLVAIDTSSTHCSVALLSGDTVAERESEAGPEHSGMALPMLMELLRAHGYALADMDCIAFGAGPGSFTGLRIACGIAQGLAAGAGLQVAAISTLEALAEEASQAAGLAGKVPVERVVACIDARMGEVYHAGYRRDKDRWRVCSPPALYAVDAIPVLNGSGWFGVGSGFAEHGARLRARQPLAAEFPWLRPRARNIAGLARTRYSCGQTTSAACALPVYLREKVALTMRERSDERHTAT